MRKGQKHTPEALLKIKKNNARTGKKFVFSKTHLENMSKANAGQVSWIKGKKQSIEHVKNRVMSRIRNGTYHHSEKTRKKFSENNKGEKCKWWKGGIYPKHLQIRHSLEYKLWRESVFQRDDYTCVWCGVHGGKLNADHIKPFAHFPELRLAIDNGRTLCVDCHKKTDTYGGRSAH